MQKEMFDKHRINRRICRKACGDSWFSKEQTDREVLEKLLNYEMLFKLKKGYLHHCNPRIRLCVSFILVSVLLKTTVYEYYKRFCNRVGSEVTRCRWHCCEAMQPKYNRTTKEWHKRKEDGTWFNKPYAIEKGSIEE